MGGAPLCSIARGQGKNKEAEEIMGILTIIVFLFKEDLLWLFGASKSTISYANDYMGIYLFCINWFGDEQFY